MVRIATLGPKGTFSEVAAKIYVNSMNIDGKIEFYNSFSKVFQSINDGVDYIIVPIENTLDGFVQQTLDLMLSHSLNLHYDLTVPVQFSFLANTEKESNIEKIYAQFKTQGQCQKFLDRMGHTKIITTESNSTSFEHVCKMKPNEGAIVPSHLAKDVTEKFEYQITNVTDYEDNQTRFVVLAKEKIEHSIDDKCTTSIVVKNSTDSPGTLFRIINQFATRKINLKYIMSRPSKKIMGKYIFFIDLEGNYYKNKNVEDSISAIKQENEVHLLGVITHI